MELHIIDEISPLKEVILGTAISTGPTPSVDEAYDPKSREHIIAGTYSREEDMIVEMHDVEVILKKHGVVVYRPEILDDYNQIFARDISFVIDNKIIVANILPEREREIEATEYVWKRVEKKDRIILPENCHVEGGDVMPWYDHIFIGTYRGDDYSDYITARTNMAAVNALQDLFPKKKVVSFNLRKSNTDPRANALHLDCCFQPLGKGKAIICKEGFLQEEEYQWLIDFFGMENCFHITSDEMYHLYSNVFSINPETIISERSFRRLNNWLRSNGFHVEEVHYQDIAKQGGLFRCSTMPLIRE